MQTLRNQILRGRAVTSERSRRLWFEMANGDRLTGVLDAPERPDPAAPLVLLVHGLTGHEDSVYLREGARWHLSRGRRTLRLNLRGSGPSRPFCRESYHAGRASDLREVFEALPGDLTDQGVFAVGFSLGGVLVANWVGRFEPPAALIGAAAISSPLDLHEAALRLAAPRNRVYQAYVLKEMRAEFLAGSVEDAPDMRAAAEAAETIMAFDDAVIAPMNGFRDALDYYERAAPGPWVPRARVPLLVVHADNDPWIPDRVHRALAADPPPHVSVLVTRGGGHVGFHGRGLATPWCNLAVDRFLQEEAGRRAVRPVETSSRAG
ncbi:MAG: alpha/beta fold hydrolase [Pseudomonadota bacterium]